MPAATLISSVPLFISRDEHTVAVAQTPASFSDIPPQNVSVSLDPPLDGLSPEDTAQGTLYVLESVLVFMSTTGRGFQVEYPAITLHAVSRAEAGPHAGEPEGAASSEEVDDLRELSIVPQTADALEPIFEALSRCAALHPDPNGSDDGEDGFIDVDSGGFEVFTGDEEQELSQVGRVRSDFINDNRYAPY
ncbi:regulator of volume decrease after cellular swelling-domain-containing protein [Mycena amicta]|nr:regulator of volume decrease after cellular swelling-domain-containing protein [Mycena amicta]